MLKSRIFLKICAVSLLSMGMFSCGSINNESEAEPALASSEITTENSDEDIDYEDYDVMCSNVFDSDEFCSAYNVASDSSDIIGTGNLIKSPIVGKPFMFANVKEDMSLEQGKTLYIPILIDDRKVNSFVTVKYLDGEYHYSSGEYYAKEFSELLQTKKKFAVVIGGNIVGIDEDNEHYLLMECTWEPNTIAPELTFEEASKYNNVVSYDDIIII